MYILFHINTEQDYGIDWDGPPVVDGSEDVVTVPTTHSPLNNVEMMTLRSLVNPLDSEDHGVTFYLAVRSFTRTIVS